MGDDGNFSLPPGFHFDPTDEELILDFLHPRAFLSPPHNQLIPTLHLHSYPPWELNGKALPSGNHWYFFSSPVTENPESKTGYWKHMDIEEPIFTAAAGEQVGVKKLYMFCTGEAQSGVGTSWFMQEYRLCGDGRRIDGASQRRKRRQKNMDFNRWVLCRVYEHDSSYQGFRYNYGGGDNNSGEMELSCLDEAFLSLDDDYDEITLPQW